MKKIIALTGSGISAESGIRTFRDSGGLWEGYDVMEVASPEGWNKILCTIYSIATEEAHENIRNEAA